MAGTARCALSGARGPANTEDRIASFVPRNLKQFKFLVDSTQLSYRPTVNLFLKARPIGAPENCETIFWGKADPHETRSGRNSFAYTKGATCDRPCGREDLSPGQRQLATGNLSDVRFLIYTRRSLLPFKSFCQSTRRFIILINLAKRLVRTRGLEPPRDCSHQHLKLARIPNSATSAYNPCAQAYHQHLATKN